MKVRSAKNHVLVVLTPKESIAFAEKLVKAAIQSGHVEEASRPEPLDTGVMEEREL